MTKLLDSKHEIDTGLGNTIGQATATLAGPRFTYENGVIRGGGLFLDVSKGVELILTLYEAYVQKTGVYLHHNASSAPQNTNMPGELLPRQFHLYEDNSITVPKRIIRASLKHRLWLFSAVLSDRRQVSMNVYPAHVLLHELHPELYTRAIRKWKPDDLGDLLSKFKIGVPRQTAGYWIRCFRTIFDDFDGDPSNMFKYCGWTVKGIEEFKGVNKKKTGDDPLPGYGPKVSSLCLMFFAELGLCEVPDDAFPVDMHVQRLFIQFHALTKNRDIGNEVMEALLRPFNCEVSRQYGLNKISQSHALWQLGRSSCTGCSRKRGNEIQCPIARECMGNINAAGYFKKGLWPEDDDIMRKGFDRTFRIPVGPLFSEE